MEEILHQLIGSFSLYLQGFTHPKWLFGISSINSTWPVLRKETTSNDIDLEPLYTTLR